MKFDTERVRERDEHGMLVKTGLLWNEARPNLVFFSCIVAGIGGVGLGLAFLVSTMSERYASSAVMMGVVSMIIIGIGLLGMFVFNRRRRGFIFHADGQMTSPYVLPNFLFRRHVDGHQENIMSLEHKALRDLTHVVALISIGGDTVWLSKNLDEWEGLKVAVQLTHALAELRAALANGGQVTTIPRAAPVAGKRSAMIA